jgi:sigma-54 specific flagellar transcriptional regulator A
VVNLIIPPLRDRPADIPLLLEHFCDRIAERLQVTGPVFSPGAVELLERYEWPGNVRELQNLVERTAIMHPPGTLIEPEHLSARVHQNQREPRSDPNSPPRIETFESDLSQIGESGQSLSDVVRSYEYGLIRQALDQSGGNKSQAAKLLRMKRTTLIEKLKKYEHEDGLPNV